MVAWSCFSEIQELNFLKLWLDYEPYEKGQYKKDGTLEIHTLDSNTFFKLLKTYENTLQIFFITKYMNW